MKKPRFNLGCMMTLLICTIVFFVIAFAYREPPVAGYFFIAALFLLCFSMIYFGIPN